MLFQTKDGRYFRGWPQDRYHYNIDVDDFCYITKVVFENGEEYVIGKCEHEGDCRKKAEKFAEKYCVSVNVLRVDRKTLDDYEFKFLYAFEPTNKRKRSLAEKVIEEKENNSNIKKENSVDEFKDVCNKYLQSLNK